MKLLHSIGLKLWLGVAVSTTCVLLASSYLGMRRTKQLWVRSLEENSARTGAVMERALRYAMLSSRKDDLHASLAMIATEPAVESLRMHDKNGRVLFSTRREEIGKRARVDSEACVVCHQAGAAKAVTISAGMSRLLDAPNGELVI